MLRLALICLLLGTALRAETQASSAGEIEITPVVRGLDEPWSVGFLPGGGLLITERDGTLLHVDGGDHRAVAGCRRLPPSGRAGCSTCWCRAISPGGARSSCPMPNRAAAAPAPRCCAGG